MLRCYAFLQASERIDQVESSSVKELKSIESLSSDSTFDLGVFASQESVDFIARFINNTGNDIDVESVTTSCGCTKADCSPIAVATGGVLTFALQVRGATGSFASDVKVKIKGRSDPWTIRLSGKAVDRFVLSKTVFAFSKETNVEYATLTAPFGDSLEFSKVLSEGTLIVVEVVESGAKQAKLKFTVKDTEDTFWRGGKSAPENFLLSLGDGKSKAIGFTAESSLPTSIFPKLIVFPLKESDQKIIVYRRGGKVASKFVRIVLGSSELCLGRLDHTREGSSVSSYLLSSGAKEHDSFQGVFTAQVEESDDQKKWNCVGLVDCSF